MQGSRIPLHHDHQKLLATFQCFTKLGGDSWCSPPSVLNPVWTAGESINGFLTRACAAASLMLVSQRVSENVKMVLYASIIAIIGQV